MLSRLEIKAAAENFPPIEAVVKKLASKVMLRRDPLEKSRFRLCRRSHRRKMQKKSFLGLLPVKSVSGLMLRLSRRRKRGGCANGWS